MQWHVGVAAGVHGHGAKACVKGRAGVGRKGGEEEESERRIRCGLQSHRHSIGMLKKYMDIV